MDFAPTLDLRYFDYRAVEDIFVLPVIIENEANAAGFAESWLQSRDQANGIYLSINKGVGGAVIVDHALSYGINRRSGEFGHMTLVPGGRRCSCGKEGCFEAYCSTRVLADLTGGDLAAFFRRKGEEPHLQQVWETYLRKRFSALHRHGGGHDPLQQSPLCESQQRGCRCRLCGCGVTAGGAAAAAVARRINKNDSTPFL